MGLDDCPATASVSQMADVYASVCQRLEQRNLNFRGRGFESLHSYMVITTKDLEPVEKSSEQSESFKDDRSSSSVFK